ncbi:hypothetical protein PIIN_06765 [Serendipita indica DSM 11827]|uniref:Bromo domain-containing protein n=1 Tax=Serendipita indica (strain DSM 11827) TaxID=1109443 RepID=G4TND2_SERID|nr:hypothetical protein PIIN_06765 [Serendipita indica DSM 11827]
MTAPENLAIAKALFHWRYKEINQHILLKEMGWQYVFQAYLARLTVSSALKKEIEAIRSGAWDDRIRQQKAAQQAAAAAEQATPAAPPAEPVPPIPSSSSSQLSSIDSPVVSKTTPVVEKPKDEGLAEKASTEMELDEADVTIKPSEKEEEEESTEKMDVDKREQTTPLTPEPLEETKASRASPKSTKEEAEEDRDEDAEGSKDEEEEEQDAPPAHGLRSHKGPALEIEIPGGPSASKESPRATRKVKSRKSSESATQTSTRGGRRRGGGTADSSKPPPSPTTASVAGTYESVATPAATDDATSVVEDGSRRRSTRGFEGFSPCGFHAQNFTGHKRKASEMEVDQPQVSKRIRDRSMTIEDEPSTPAVQPPASRSTAASTATAAPHPRLRQSMTQILTLLSQNKHADIFRRPVTVKEAPEYAKAVRKPIDLATIQRAVKAGQYRSWDELERDLRRMLANCFVFNKPGTEAHESAKLILVEVEQVLQTARE